MHKRHRPNWPLRLCIGGVLLVALAHTLVMPTWEFLAGPHLSSPTEQALRQSIFLDQVIRHGLESVVGLWILFFGASIGSFLNVVVYRLPRGGSLVAKGSYCPHCRVPIRSSDNIPVLGWLKLRGRCRACRLPISPRYPIVEAWVGLLYFVLFCVELASGGANLPGFDRSQVAGTADIILAGRWDLCGIFFFHATLFSILVPAILIRWDGHRLPIKLIAFGVIFPAIVVPAFPWLIDWFNQSREAFRLTQHSLYPWTALPRLEGTSLGTETVRSVVTFAIGTSLGLAVGGLLGGVATWCGWQIDRRGSEWRSAVIGFAWCGAFLGWQSLFAVATWLVIVLAVATLVSFRAAGLREVSLLGWISLAIFAHLVSWRLTSQLPWMPSEAFDVRWWLLTSIIAIVGISGISWVRRRVSGNSRASSHS